MKCPEVGEPHRGAGPKLQGLFPNLLLKAEWELFVLGALVGWRVSLLMHPVPTKDSTSTFHPYRIRIISNLSRFNRRFGQRRLLILLFKDTLVSLSLFRLRDSLVTTLGVITLCLLRHSQRCSSLSLSARSMPALLFS